MARRAAPTTRLISGERWRTTSATWGGRSTRQTDTKSARPAARRDERLAEHVLERQSSSACGVEAAAQTDLPHEVRTAQHVDRLLQPLVLGMVDEDGGRLALAGHDDLLLATLDSAHQLGQA